MKMSIKELEDVVIDGVRFVGTTLDPEADWEPTMFMVTPEGVQLVSFGEMVNSDDSKDVMSLAMNTLLRSQKATGAALILTAWTLPAGTPDAMSWAGRISEHPLRREVLFVTLVTASEQLLLQADIKRGGSHPELSEFKRFPGAGAEGRFLDAMRQALMGLVVGGMALWSAHAIQLFT